MFSSCQSAKEVYLTVISMLFTIFSSNTYIPGIQHPLFTTQQVQCTHTPCIVVLIALLFTLRQGNVSENVWGNFNFNQVLFNSKTTTQRIKVSEGCVLRNFIFTPKIKNSFLHGVGVGQGLGMISSLVDQVTFLVFVKAKIVPKMWHNIRSVSSSVKVYGYCCKTLCGYLCE